ncbi:reverse transcriptase domain-containing protein [Tanacetum coccineum]
MVRAKVGKKSDNGINLGEMVSMVSQAALAEAGLVLIILSERWRKGSFSNQGKAEGVLGIRVCQGRVIEVRTLNREWAPDGERFGNCKLGLEQEMEQVKGDNTKLKKTEVEIVGLKEMKQRLKEELHYNEGVAGCTPHTCVNMSISNTSNSEPLMLDQLELGVTGTIVVMICRMWDVNSATGRYLSTDFIVSDEKGNLMHCTARGNVAHNFLRLKEGAIYSVKNFTVQPNKDDFRVLRFAHFIVEMDGDTVVRKSSVRPDGFARYPFQLVEFDSLEPTNNKYLIGKALNSYISLQLTLCHSIPFSNQRAVPMSVKLYNNRLYLSSTSSTMIVDDEQIHVITQFKSDDSGTEIAKELLPVDSTGAKAGTLENLLMWARNRKYDVSCLPIPKQPHMLCNLLDYATDTV